MKFALTFLIVFFMHSTQSQNLSDHRWQHRVLIIIGEDTTQTELKKQLAELNLYEEELKERKLIIYQLTSDTVHKGLGNEMRKKETELYQKYKDLTAPFQVILIGLDGGEKLKQNEFLSANKLFSIIDGMPMRKAEIRKKS